MSNEVICKYTGDNKNELPYALLVPSDNYEMAVPEYDEEKVISLNRAAGWMYLRATKRWTNPNDEREFERMTRKFGFTDNQTRRNLDSDWPEMVSPRVWKWLDDRGLIETIDEYVRSNRSQDIDLFRFVRQLIEDNGSDYKTIDG